MKTVLYWINFVLFLFFWAVNSKSGDFGVWYAITGAILAFGVGSFLWVVIKSDINANKKKQAVEAKESERKEAADSLFMLNENINLWDLAVYNTPEDVFNHFENTSTVLHSHGLTGRHIEPADGWGYGVHLMEIWVPVANVDTQILKMLLALNLLRRSLASTLLSLYNPDMNMLNPEFEELVSGWSDTECAAIKMRQDDILELQRIFWGVIATIGNKKPTRRDDGKSLGTGQARWMMEGVNDSFDVVMGSTDFIQKMRQKINTFYKIFTLSEEQNPFSDAFVAYVGNNPEWAEAPKAKTLNLR